MPVQGVHGTSRARQLKECPDRLSQLLCMLHVQGPIGKWADRAANQDPLEGRLDAEAAAQAHINAVSGACLALGIKYAGSASEAAQKLLHAYVMYFLTGKQAAPDPVSGAVPYKAAPAQRCTCWSSDAYIRSVLCEGQGLGNASIRQDSLGWGSAWSYIPAGLHCMQRCWEAMCMPVRLVTRSAPMMSSRYPQHATCRFETATGASACLPRLCLPTSHPQWHPCSSPSDSAAGAAAVWGLLDKQALENCLGVVLLALSLVMAGTGHVVTFKLIRGRPPLHPVLDDRSCSACIPRRTWTQSCTARGARSRRSGPAAPLLGPVQDSADISRVWSFHAPKRPPPHAAFHHLCAHHTAGGACTFAVTRGSSTRSRPHGVQPFCHPADPKRPCLWSHCPKWRFGSSPQAPHSRPSLRCSFEGTDGHLADLNMPGPRTSDSHVGQD